MATSQNHVFVSVTVWFSLERPVCETTIFSRATFSLAAVYCGCSQFLDYEGSKGPVPTTGEYHWSLNVGHCRTSTFLTGLYPNSRSPCQDIADS